MGCRAARAASVPPGGDPDSSDDDNPAGWEGAARDVRMSPRRSPRSMEGTAGEQRNGADAPWGWLDAASAVLAAVWGSGSRAGPPVPRLHLPAPGAPAQRAEPAAVAEDPRRRMARRKRLVLATIVLSWFASGALVFSSMDLGPLRTMYLMVQIITTVGYGDFVPETQGQKLACTAVVLSSTLLVANVVMASVSDMQDKIGGEVAFDVDAMTRSIQTHLEAEEERKVSLSARGACPTEELVRPYNFAHEQHQQHWKRISRDLTISASIFMFCLVAGIVFFKLADPCSTRKCDNDKEHVHTWTDALYMSVITMSTVGFGDIVPQSKIGRAFATIWMMVGVAVTFRLLGSVSSVIDHTLRADVQAQMSRQLFHESDENGDGHLDVLEFIKLQFVQNGFVTKEQFDAVHSQFKLIAGHDDRISIDEYADYFLPDEVQEQRRSNSSRSAE